MALDFKQYSDETLHVLLKEKENSSKAFSVIYDRYCSFAIAFIRNMIRSEDTAQEIFQEVFIRLYNFLISSNNLVNIPGMITTIARNLIFNTKRNTKQIVDIDSIQVQSLDHLEIERNELLDLILNSLEFLEEKYRNVFILRELNGMSFKEIAEVEKVSVANAKLRSTRAKRKLIEILRPYIADLEKS